MLKFKVVSLGNDNYFNLSIGKRVLKKNIRNLNGEIPIYSANVSNPIGYTDISIIQDFDSDYVLWGIDGDFKFRIKKKGEKFYPTDHCGFIKIKDEGISPEYLLYYLDKVKDIYGFDRGLRSSISNMKRVEIKIPISENNSFDIGMQSIIANRYIIIEDLKNKIHAYRNTLKDIKISIENQDIRMKSILIPKIFNIFLGKSLYNCKYFNEHKGNFPVYSAQTKNKGKEIANIDSYDYNTEGLTWTIDGYAGMVFYRNGKFSMTTHCGLLELKKEYRNKLDYEFLSYILNNELPCFAVGEGNKRLKKTHILKIAIKIPIDKNGNFDLLKQKILSNKYKSIEQIKNKVLLELERIIQPSIKLI